MRAVVNLILLAAFTAITFAGTKPAVPIAALKTVETAANTRFLPDGNDPWDLLGVTRGTYLPGYGAIFTFEMSLVFVTPVSPFHMTVTPAEVKAAHERKVKKLVVLKGAMRDLLLQAASTLATMPPSEQISLQAVLVNFSFEDNTGLPHRLMMTATRQKLLDAATTHADLATVIEEQEE